MRISSNRVALRAPETLPKNQMRLPAFAEFMPHPDARKRIESALNAVRALLAADLIDAHKRELLSVCIWKLSLAEGKSKYTTRFMSAASSGRIARHLAHEHVHERAKLVSALLSGALAPDNLSALAVACTVTRDEHVRLTAVGKVDPSIDGWERYRIASVAVIDCAQACWHIAP
jgi:hypothetical protein